MSEGRIYSARANKKGGMGEISALGGSPIIMEDEHEFRDQTIVTSIPEFAKEKDKRAYVIFLSGSLVGKIHLLEEGVTTLGRGNDVGIPINDLGISRHHASITYKDGRATLQDLGSTNGTYLNGLKIEEKELQDGDKIQISSSTILKYAYQDKIENIFHNELYKMAVVDAPTGAYNKRFFEERLKEEFNYSQRNKIPLSLIFFDIDHFKQINDTYGHPAGDHVLRHLTTLAQSIIRGDDILCRIGGEEFAVILRSTEKEGSLLLSERLRRLIDESQFEFEGKPLHITISLGTTIYKGSGLPDWESFVKKADALLYKSKKSGRNRVSSD